MNKVVGAVAAVVVALVVAGVVWLEGGGSASGQPPAPKPVAAKAVAAKAVAASVTGPIVTKTYNVTAAGQLRAYEVITPVKALPKTAPIIVMLSGIAPAAESGKQVITGEMGRDDLIQYASSDQAEIVYPEPLYGSWDAIGCCGQAATEKVNDVAFLEALVAQVDPGHARQIDVIGYSNGGRLAYRVVCDDPGLFDEYAMVKGEPTAGCDIRKPVTILQLASANDPEVPFKPGDRGSVESLPTTTLVSRLHTIDKCPTDSTSYHSGEMTQTTWSGCVDGTRLGFAVWSGGEHLFPRPPSSVPAASQVIWAFFTQTPFAPLPK